MTLRTHQTTPGLATTQHPHFVGLALLRSLLGHEDVAGDAAKTDAVLDMITVLMRQGTAKNALEAFYQMKSVCGPVCYLALFRLRRWLEQQIMVRAGDSEWRSVELTFGDMRRMVQACRRQVWEWEDVGAAPVWQAIDVVFAWSGVPEVLEPLPVA